MKKWKSQPTGRSLLGYKQVRVCHPTGSKKRGEVWFLFCSENCYLDTSLPQRLNIVYRPIAMTKIYNMVITTGVMSLY